MKKMMDNLIDFDIPCADLLKTKVTEVAQQAREVLDLEESTSIKKYPSIRPLLRYFLGPLTVAHVAAAHLGNHKTNLLMQQFVHSDFESLPLEVLSISKEIACFENEDDMAILERNINDLEGLLATAREVGRDPFSPQLVHGEYPPLVKNLALLQATIMKDSIKWRQQDYYRLSLEA
ncbi:hypothetical protein AMTRI_Chr13g88390 [Amborella trichopoda]